MRTLPLLLVLSLAACGGPPSEEETEIAESDAVAAAACTQDMRRASERYVSPAGDDRADGSFSRPFRTLARGVSTLGPGKALYVMPGTYAESLIRTIPSGTARASARIAGCPSATGERPRIQPPPGAARVIELQAGPTRAEYIVISGLLLDARYTRSDAVKFNAIDGQAVHPRNIRITDCEIRFSENQGVLGSCDDCAITQSSIHDNGVALGRHGLYLKGEGITLDSNEIYRNFGCALRNGGMSDATIRNNFVYQNGTGFLTSTLQVPVGATSVTYNVLYDNTNQAGMVIGPGPHDFHVLVRRNQIFKNRGYGIAAYFTNPLEMSLAITGNTFGENGVDFVQNRGVERATGTFSFDGNRMRRGSGPPSRVIPEPDSDVHPYTRTWSNNLEMGAAPDYTAILPRISTRITASASPAIAFMAQPAVTLSARIAGRNAGDRPRVEWVVVESPCTIMGSTRDPSECAVDLPRRASLTTTATFRTSGAYLFRVIAEVGGDATSAIVRVFVYPDRSLVLSAADFANHEWPIHTSPSLTYVSELTRVDPATGIHGLNNVDSLMAAFPGPNGTYDITVGSFDVEGGAAVAELGIFRPGAAFFVPGVAEVVRRISDPGHTWVLDAPGPRGRTPSVTNRSAHVIRGVALETNDVLVLSGRSDGLENLSFESVRFQRQ